jgi:tetratricopeptide (TPR) repeat protein
MPSVFPTILRSHFKMKTSLVVIVLTFAGIASGQQATAQPQSQPAAPAQTQPAASQPQPQPKKEIKDPAEYNAYVSAVQQTDAAAKISGVEAFLAQYPNSVMKEDALDVLMKTYQQTGNLAKVIETANRLLVANPNNVDGLVLLAYNERAAQKWADARQHAERGLQALSIMPKPDGMSDADFEKQKTQYAGVLNSVAGFSALQLKDNAAAEKYLRAAVEANPNNVDDVYPLALACLTATPEDDVNGLFFIARAVNLVKDPAGKAQITKFGHSKYVKYHGSEEGWNELLTLTASTPLPLAGFTIKAYVPPTPAEQAADLVKSKTAKEMSFAEWELVLSAGAPADADKVWSAIKGVPLQMEGTVMAATPTELQIAASQDDIDQKRADIVVTMGGTIPAKLMPKEGATLDFEGTPLSYAPTPFVMTMEKGALLTKAPPAVPKKPAPRRHPTH